MKTLLKASGIGSALAFMSAIGLVGCSAEPLSPEEAADIGVTSQALSSAGLTALTSASPDIRLRAGAQCTFKEVVSGVTSLYHVKAGGIASATGAASNVISMSKDSGAWVTQAAVLSSARAQIKVVQLSDTECALFSGSSTAALGGTANAAVDVLSLDTSNPTRIVAQATGGSLAVAREGGVVSTCTDNNSAEHFVYIGGTGTRDVQVGPLATAAGLAGSWTNHTNILTENREDFDADRVPGANQYLVASGVTAATAPNPSAFVELFSMTTGAGTCTPQAATKAATPLSVAVKGAAVFYDSTKAKFIVTKGIKRVGAANSLFTDGEIVTTNFGSSPPNITRAVLGTVIGAYQPSKIRVDNNTVVMLGGADATLANSIDKVEKYTNPAGTVGLSSITLGAPAYQGAAAGVIDGKIDFVGGFNLATPGFVTQAVAITP